VYVALLACLLALETETSFDFDLLSGYAARCVTPHGRPVFEAVT